MFKIIGILIFSSSNYICMESSVPLLIFYFLIFGHKLDERIKKSICQKILGTALVSFLEHFEVEKNVKN